MNSILENTLEKISKQIESIEDSWYINRGGCCYFAYLIARQLTKRNIPYLLVIEDPWESTRALNNKAFKILKRKGHGCKHVVLKIGSKLYDSDGLKHEDKDDIYEFFMWTPKNIINYYKNNRWNDSFQNVSDYSLRKIKGIINNEFKRYDKIEESRY